MKKKSEKRLCAMISEIGALTRQRIRELPEGEDRDIAWAAVACAIVGAALHEGDRRKVMQLVTAVASGMAASEILFGEQH